jgi:hypothetical protein
MATTITGEGAAMGGQGSSAMGTGGTAEANTQDLAVKKQWVLDQLQRLRNFRRPYDQRRAYFYRQYIGQRDRKMFPDNLTARSNTFVPYPSSNVEAVVSRIHDAFFSVDPPLEVRARGGTDDSAIAMQCVMLSVLHKAKWIKAIELFSRDLGIYGHAGLKVDWDWEYDIVTGPEPVYAQGPQMDPSTGGPQMDENGQPIMGPIPGPDGQPMQIGTKMVSKPVPRNCPKLIPIDIYDLLIDPDEKVKAHVYEQSWGEMRRSAEANSDLYFPEALAELTNRLSQYKELDRDGIIIRMAEFWDDTNKTMTQVTFGEDADAIGWKDRRYQYRNASYSAYKRRVYNGPPVLLYTGPNPFAHKRIPILDAAYIKIKGDTYGIGLIEKITDLVEGMNVFTNMITDNWNMGINRRYAYDVQVDIDHDQLDMGNVPGGKVGVVGNPANALMALPLFTPNPGDYQILELYRGMIELNSGISDFYAKGVGSPTGNRTSSGIGQVINESGYVFKLLIRNIELDILQPMMEMVASMIQQFGSPQLEYSITNAPPGIPMYGTVPLEKITGGFDFDFVSANYATGKVVKQRNLMAFYNIAMQSPYAVQSEFLREIARAMEIPFANRLLKSDQQVQQEQQAAQQQQMEQAVIEKLLDFESKALVAGISKAEPNSVTAHASAVQQTIEDFMEETAGLPTEPGGMLPTTNSRHEGNPAGPGGQLEGQIPGGEVEDQMRGYAQENGSNSLGLAGT